MLFINQPHTKVKQPLIIKFVKSWKTIFKKFYSSNSNINILEIGSYRGESASFFLDQIKNATITCVDTWEGSDENISRGENFAEVENDFNQVEKKFKISDLAKRLKLGKALSKTSSIVIVAEGNNHGSCYKIAEDLSQVFDEYESKVTILGHLQRGGSPLVMDRVLASRMGLSAIQALLSDKSNHMVGIIDGKNVLTPMKDVVEKQKTINQELYKLNKIISR